MVRNRSIVVKKLVVAIIISPWLVLGMTYAAEPLEIRILSYNIHHARGMDDKLDLPRIAAVISSVQPDLVSLQEVDQNVTRSENVDQPAELARLTEMVVRQREDIAHDPRSRSEPADRLYSDVAGRPLESH